MTDVKMAATELGIRDLTIDGDPAPSIEGSTRNVGFATS